MSLRCVDPPPIVWSIGGSDSCSGAGVQADLKTMTALGAHCCTVITALTAQNSYAIQDVTISPFESIKSQLMTLQQDFPPLTIKIGMLGDGKNAQAVVDYLQEFPNWVVYDPVLASSSGTPLFDRSAMGILRKQLFPLVRVLTPNLPEAEELVGYSLETPELIEKAAIDLVSFGAKSVVIKGGHSHGNLSQDFWTNGTQSAWIKSTRRNSKGQGTKSARGTGCTFASALAVAIAFGFDDLDAVVIAKSFVNQSLRTSKQLGLGSSILQYKPWPPDCLDFPWLSSNASSNIKEASFKSCGSTVIGFYPVVDSEDWLRRLLPLGVKTAQLRIKNMQGYQLEKEIRKSVSFAREHQCRLFINDYWDIALREGAYGVHLGQEDLETAQIEKLLKAHTRLGVSTHCYSEVARAHSLRPSYLAIGPIFPTTLKTMRFAPQGVNAFRIWRQLLDYRLVAIGGVTLDTADELMDAGADGIAVVSDITKNCDPEARVKAWLKRFPYSELSAE